jgi:hypothetical protein
MQSRADPLRGVPIGPTSPNAQVRTYLCVAPTTPRR